MASVRPWPIETIGILSAVARSMHRVGDAGREGVEHRGAGRALVLQALVALDAALDLVLGLALLPGQLDAVDAAVARVEHVEVVDEAAEEAGAAGGVGPDAVALQREELLVLARARAGRRRAPRTQRGEVRTAATRRACRVNLLMCEASLVSAQTHLVLIVLGSVSVRERPEAELLLSDLPEPREAVRLDDQEEDDQRAEDDQLEVGRRGSGSRVAGKSACVDHVQEDRQQHDEGGAEERAEDAAQAADDDDEQDLERAGQIEGLRLDRCRDRRTPRARRRRRSRRS